MNSIALDIVKHRFWDKVKVIEGSCWEWQAYRNACGYGVVGAGGKKTALAHRVAWLISGGLIPDGLFVLHKCDNPPCCNPDHLYVGGYKENAHDRESRCRGNQPKGSHHNKAVLTEESVLKIRSIYGPNKASDIALIFGVHRDTIYDIVRRRTWKHI